MYERSAIVLEKYFNNMFGFNQKTNLKTIYKNYKEIVEEIQKYKEIIDGEEQIISQFDEVANKIRDIQQEQKKLYKSNIKLEEDRNQLFDNLDEQPLFLEKNIKKIESTVEKNNSRLKELRESFIQALTQFDERQKERNKYSRIRRNEESNHLQLIEKAKNDIEEIDVDTLKELKLNLLVEDVTEIKKEITELMINNGKDERVGFNEEVIKNAVNTRILIAKKEAECYILSYDRIKKLLIEIENDEIKLDKFNKALRDINIKLAFLKSEKNYIVNFLDNERMTAMYGLKLHKKMMSEACKCFELDTQQFDNLYELILREISGKSTKKAYLELYDKEYLKNIEEKERSFEKELNNVKINAGTIINSNFWRIDGIKNIYEVFQNEVSNRFNKDLSELKLEEREKLEEEEEKTEKIEESEEPKETQQTEKTEEVKPEKVNKNGLSIDDLLDYDYSKKKNKKHIVEEDESDIEEQDEYEEEYEDDDEFEYFEDDDEDYDNDEDDNDDIFQDEDENDETDDRIDKEVKNSKGIFNKFFGDKKGK